MQSVTCEVGVRELGLRFRQVHVRQGLAAQQRRCVVQGTAAVAAHQEPAEGRDRVQVPVAHHIALVSRERGEGGVSVCGWIAEWVTG